MLVQVTGTKLVRDTESMALINKDINGLEEYNLKRRMMATQKEEINNIKSEINNIKNDMNEIKLLMLQLLDKSNG
jgi:hypothetical protein